MTLRLSSLVWHSHAFEANTQLDIPGSPLYPLLNLSIPSQYRTPTTSTTQLAAQIPAFFLTDTSSSSSETYRLFVFSGCMALLSPRCFHCCQEGSVIKLHFLCLFLCLTVSVVGWSVCSCCGGTLGTQAIVLREVTGRSDLKSMRKRLSAALNSISAK